MEDHKSSDLEVAASGILILVPSTLVCSRSGSRGPLHISGYNVTLILARHRLIHYLTNVVGVVQASAGKTEMQDSVLRILQGPLLFHDTVFQSLKGQEKYWRGSRANCRTTAAGSS